MATESELRRIHAIEQLETAIQALRIGMDSKAQYQIQGAQLNVDSLVEERKREAVRKTHEPRI